MHVGTPLSVRLSFTISAILAVVTLAGGAYVIQKARADMHDETASTLALTRHFFDAQIRDLQVTWRATGYSAPQFRLQDLGDIRHLTVRYYGSDDRLLDSNDDPRKSSVAPRWFGALIRAAGTPVRSETLPLSFNTHALGRLVIAPDPSYETDEMWSTCAGLFSLLLCFFVLVNGAVWWAATRALRPVERILQGLAELRGGRLSARLPPFGLPELSRISVGFNHMAESLEKSVLENQSLTRRLVEARESERTSIAHELHDEIGQCVSAIHADAAAIRNRGGESVRESAEAIAAVTSHLKVIVRSMLLRLRPPMMEGVGLGAALRSLVTSFQQRTPQTACTLTVSDELRGRSDAVGVAIYRIVQECLTNIAVHADAESASVEVEAVHSAGEHIRVLVKDDGVGFLNAVNQGLGLTGIQERARALRGHCSIETRPGAGTQVAVLIPLAAESASVT